MHRAILSAINEYYDCKDNIEELLKSNVEQALAEKVSAAGLSDAQLYKQAGNAVTVNVVEELARNLKRFDKEVRRLHTIP